MNKTRALAIASASIVTLFAGWATVASAQTTEYVPLTTVPGLFKQGSSTNPVTIIKGIYGLAIGIGSVIATVMLIIAGFEYMYQESITGKSQAKERITNAFLGLLVILGSYILLRTINPALVDFNLTLQGGSNRLKGLIADKAYDDLRERQKALQEDQTAINKLKANGVEMEKLIEQKEDTMHGYDCENEDKADCERIEKEIAELETRVKENTDNIAATQIEQGKGIASTYVYELLETRYWELAGKLRQDNGQGELEFDEFLQAASAAYKSSIDGVEKQLVAIKAVQTNDAGILKQKTDTIRDLENEKKYLALAATYVIWQNSYDNNGLDLTDLANSIKYRTDAYTKKLKEAGFSNEFIEERVKRDRTNLITAFSMSEEVQEDCASNTDVLPADYAQLCSNA